MNDLLRTVIIIAFFSFVFVSVGWIAPAMYASYAPQSHYIEAHSFDAHDVSPSQSEHTTCFDRTVKRDAHGSVITELYLVRADGERIEVQSENKERAFQQGRRTIEIDTQLPSDLEEGTYRYERVYKMKLANGRVTRTFIFMSNTFDVRKAGNQTSRRC